MINEIYELNIDIIKNTDVCKNMTLSSNYNIPIDAKNINELIKEQYNYTPFHNSNADT
jgi:hypothetical protein